MQSGAAFSGSARAAAIAVGTLDTPAKEFVRPFPKQVPLLCVPPLFWMPMCPLSRGMRWHRPMHMWSWDSRTTALTSFSILLVQVIVVVTHGWHVLCFDHNLQLLWDRSIKVRSGGPKT